MTCVARTVVDLRVGQPHSNCGLSLKMAYAGHCRPDRRIDLLLSALCAVPYRLS